MENFHSFIFQIWNQITSGVNIVETKIVYSQTFEIHGYLVNTGECISLHLVDVIEIKGTVAVWWKMMVIWWIYILLIFRYMWYILHIQSWYINHFSKNVIYLHLPFSNYNIINLLCFEITDQEDNICVRRVIRCVYLLWLKFHNIGEYFAWIVTIRFTLLKSIPIIQVAQTDFCVHYH